MTRVLIVDDEPNVSESLSRLLSRRQLGCTCDRAATGTAALEKLNRSSYDVIILDVQMPGKDGIEILARLKADPVTQHIPVLMLTGNTDKHVKQVAWDLGAYDFIDKPADASELVARLGNAIRMKEYQDQLRQQNTILEKQLLHSQRMELVGFFATGIVHDLNNILSGIVGTAELAASNTCGEKGVQEALARVRASAHNASRLVKQILSLGRDSEHATPFSDLAEIIDESIKLMAVAASENVRIDWDKPASACPAAVDPIQIHQIIMNLTMNAVQAMPQGGVLTIRLKPVALDSWAAASLGDLSSGSFIKLEVEDTGVGMEPSTLEHIFEPFYSTKPEGVGTGVGLSVVQRIVQNHGGAVTVDSRPDHGSRFHVYIPGAVKSGNGRSGCESEGADDTAKTNPVCG